MPTVCTTVTLDRDVAEQLETLARRRNISFEAASNNALREGLAAERGVGTPYRVPSRRMELRPDVDLTYAVRFAESLEDEETVRNMESRA